MSSRKQKRISSKFIGVHQTNNGQFQAKLIFQGKSHTFGPFATEEDAARQYDVEVLKRDPRRTILNFPNKEQSGINMANRLKNIRKKINKTHGHKDLSKKQKNKDKFIREQFPTVMRNKICAKQQWKCNFCQEVLSDKIIIDHMVPLFLGGSNATFNLQGICPSCDRFKTSYLDHKILKPMNEKQPLTVKDVIRIQKEHFCMMSCKDPNEPKDDKGFSEQPAKRIRRTNPDEESYSPSDDSDSEIVLDEPELNIPMLDNIQLYSDDNDVKLSPIENDNLEPMIHKIQSVPEHKMRKILTESDSSIRTSGTNIRLEPISITVGKTLIQISQLN